MSRYDVNAIRNQVKKKLGGHRDPAEFRPPKAETGDKPIRFRFYVLPPIQKGDKIASGASERDMELFFLENGAHYIEGKRIGCPRVTNDEECDVCTFAFDCIKEIKDRGLDKETEKAEVRKVSSSLLPGAYRMVNIYFPGSKLGSVNPEEYRDKVFWYNAPATVFQHWWDCLSRDDDGGDELNPEPFGVFYDEEDAYLYTLEIVKKGKGNSYETSAFVVKENFKSHPIARTKNGPDVAKITEILEHRHDLFGKLPEVNNDELKRIANELSGDDGGYDIVTEGNNKKTNNEQPMKNESSGKKSGKKGGIKPPVSGSSGSSNTTVDDLSLDDLDDDFSSSSKDTTNAGGNIADELPAADDDDDEVDALLSQLTDGD